MSRRGSVPARGALTIAIAVAIATAVAGAARSATTARHRVLTVTTTVRRCPDCSLPERSRPSRMRLPAPGVGVITLRGMKWTAWGSGGARAHGAAAIAKNGIDHGSARVTLFRLRSHTPDECGHTAADRIYTRVRIRLRGFSLAGHNRAVTIALPRTGCETF